MKPFDPARIRGQFPALNQSINGRAPVFLDGPGGTQVPQSVLDAMNKYLGLSNSNLLKSPFFAVEETHKIVRLARESAAAFVNASSPNEIVFGANMSTITAHFSRSISRDWKEGDEIILTALDHYANVSYWRMVAADRGVKVHVLPLKADDCTLDYDQLERMISPKTKFVAFGLASNVCGSLSQPLRIIKPPKASAR